MLTELDTRTYCRAMPGSDWQAAAAPPTRMTQTCETENKKEETFQIKCCKPKKRFKGFKRWLKEGSVNRVFPVTLWLKISDSCETECMNTDFKQPDTA